VRRRGPLGHERRQVEEDLARLRRAHRGDRVVEDVVGVLLARLVRSLVRLFELLFLRLVRGQEDAAQQVLRSTKHIDPYVAALGVWLGLEPPHEPLD